MKKTLKGYSLVEALVVVFAIGVLTIVSIVSLKQARPNYIKPYYTAYNTLQQVVGNAFLNWQPSSATDNVLLAQNWGNEVKGEKYPRENPGFLTGREELTTTNLDGEGTTGNFCRMLTRNMNTADNAQIQCESYISKSTPIKADTFNFTQAVCPWDVKSEEDAAGNITNTFSCRNNDSALAPSFVNGNGQKFFISDIVYAAIEEEKIPAGGGAAIIEQRRIPFRFVVVDLNGDKRPNSSVFTTTTNSEGKVEISEYPDIVVFAITNNGVVIPLGLPVYNLNYAAAVIRYPKFFIDSSGNPTTPESITSTPTTIYNATARAWSAGSGDTDKGVFDSQLFVKSKPISYAYFLNSLGGSNTKLPDVEGNETDHEYIKNMMKIFTNNHNPAVFYSNISEDLLDTQNGCTYGVNSPCEVEIQPAK